MRVAAIDPGQRRMNGPQTSGRDDRNLNDKDARPAIRVLAAVAVAAVVWGWGRRLAQYPSVLPESLTIDQAVSVLATLAWLVVVVIAVLLLVVPSRVLAFRLNQQSRLEGSPQEVQS
ncbi:MAG: cytochrome d ubiquinol oxidase subunit II [Chloroflexi bacterium]|nr:cytochrome d ubiquinol oxidase subunit II [Chloroflexota bacterium]